MQGHARAGLFNEKLVQPFPATWQRPVRDYSICANGGDVVQQLQAAPGVASTAVASRKAELHAMPS